MQTLDQQDIPGSIKDVINTVVWKLLDSDEDEEIFRFRKWFFSFVLTIKDLEPLFTRIFGPRPIAS